MEHIVITGAVIAGKSMFSMLIGDVYGLLVKDITQHPMLKPVLDKLDLEADLKVIEALTNQLDKMKVDPQGPVGICLSQVEELVKKIKGELEEIHKIIKEHYEIKWFSGWRNPDCKVNLDALVTHKKILDQRVQMLIRLMNAAGYKPY